MLSVEAIRRDSLKVAERLGYPINEKLPLTDGYEHLRSEKEVIDRVLVLFCIVAVAHESSAKRAKDWLASEKLLETITPMERAFLIDGDLSNRNVFRAQEESLWALTWALGLVPELDFANHCQPILASLFPDLIKNDDSTAFRKKCTLRPVSAILRKADLAYCLHWGLRHASLERKQLSTGVEPYVVIERRRALEWLLRDEDWDTISLDT